MIYEYILLDEEKMLKENPTVVANDKYAEILKIAEQYNMKKSEPFYETEKGLWIKSDDSDNEFVNAGIFFMVLTDNKWLLKYITHWYAIHNFDDEDEFVTENVLDSIRKYSK
jgi:hypothetical protein